MSVNTVNNRLMSKSYSLMCDQCMTELLILVGLAEIQPALVR